MKRAWDAMSPRQLQLLYGKGLLSEQDIADLVAAICAREPRMTLNHIAAFFAQTPRLVIDNTRDGANA